MRKIVTIFYFVTYKFQSYGRTVEAISASASVIFSISRIVLDPRWHETSFQCAIVDISDVGRSE